jgi:O-antigen/teichoic acid export membrane protein
MGDSTLRNNTMWTTVGQMSTVGLQAVYFIMISRTLGSYDYGLFVGVYSLVAVLSPYSTLGFGMVMLRDASRNPDCLPVSWGKALSMLCLGSIVITLIVLTASRIVFHASLLKVVFCIAVSEVFCARAVELAGQAFQARHQLGWTAHLNALMGLARTLAALCLSLYCSRMAVHATVLLWALTYSFFSLLSVMLALWIVHWRLVRPKWSSLSRRECSEGFSFALSSSSFSIYNDIDKTMLASYGFIEAAGTYAAAYRIIEVVTAPMRALYTAAMPRIFEQGATGSKEVLPLILKLLKYSALYAVIAFVVLIWSAPEFAHLLGRSFAASVPAIRMLALIPLLRCFHYAAGNAISGCTSQWYRTASQIFAAVFNVTLCMLWLPHWSWKGAALASLITDGSLGVINWATFLYLHHRQVSAVNQLPEVTS